MNKITLLYLTLSTGYNRISENSLIVFSLLLGVSIVLGVFLIINKRAAYSAKAQNTNTMHVNIQISMALTSIDGGILFLQKRENSISRQNFHLKQKLYLF